MRDVIYTDKNIIGERIDNIEETGALTGRYFSDLHGTWYEVKPDKRNGEGLYLYFWVVGEPREGDTPSQGEGLIPLPDFKEEVCTLATDEELAGEAQLDKLKTVLKTIDGECDRLMDTDDIDRIDLFDALEIFQRDIYNALNP